MHKSQTANSQAIPKNEAPHWDNSTKPLKSVSLQPWVQPKPPSPLSEILAVRLINEALQGDCPEKTLRALLLPSANLANVMLPRAKRYHFVLAQMLRQKAQVGKEGGDVRGGGLLS